MSFRQRLCSVVVVCASLLCGGVLAADAALPDSLEFSALVNQFGQPFRGQEKMAIVMLVSGMKMKGVAQDALALLNTDCLRQGKVVYLANISGMPKFISKLIAVPRMRELDYPIWLDYSGETAGTLPARKDQVTLLSLVSPQTVGAVSYVDSPKVLREQLLPQCGARIGS